MITLVQLEYIVAVDTWRHFATAAEKSFVTQPTLSMQIKKLEEDLGVIIFDRSKQPVVPTDAGKAIIEQARVVLGETNKIYEKIKEVQGIVSGELKIAIIPTLAPYLIPRFTGSFIKKYPSVSLIIKEMLTEEIVEALKKDQIDAGILVTPIDIQGIIEKPLFYEKFLVYAGKNETVLNKEWVSAEDLEETELWMLSSGHCFRNQVVNLCKSNFNQKLKFQFESGSLETLIKIVDTNGGITILPELTVLELHKERLKQIKPFGKTPSFREISLVFSRNYSKERLLSVFSQAIMQAVPQEMTEKKGKNIVSIK